jgi:hypothetical protein
MCNNVISNYGVTNSVAQEPEGSSPHSQQLAAGPYPDPVESNTPPPSSQSDYDIPNMLEDFLMSSHKLYHKIWC